MANNLWFGVSRVSGTWNMIGLVTLEVGPTTGGACTRRVDEMPGTSHRRRTGYAACTWGGSVWVAGVCEVVFIVSSPMACLCIVCSPYCITTYTLIYTSHFCCTWCSSLCHRFCDQSYHLSRIKNRHGHY